MVPSSLGGLGATFATYSAVAHELAQANGSLALVFNMHASVTGALAHTSDQLLAMLGAPEHARTRRDEILTEAASGAFYAVAMSERASGARLSAISTTYSSEVAGFHITGTKSFVSGADLADAFLVAARAEERDLVSYFLVPAGPGVVVVPNWDSMGMRGTGSHDVTLDVTVGRDALLGGVEGVVRIVADTMPQWLVASYAAVYVGVARSAIDAAVEHLRSRGLTDLPAVRARIGRADAQVAAAELVVATAAKQVDEDPGSTETNRWVWRAKLAAGDTAAEVASSMLEAAGSGATRRGNPLERIYRDARCGALQPATSDVCADWLGAAALGLDPNRSAIPRW